MIHIGSEITKNYIREDIKQILILRYKLNYKKEYINYFRTDIANNRKEKLHQYNRINTEVI
jgi:hypothetical protein